MQPEVDLLRSLDDEPDTPSKVDIVWAISAGRRRKMRRGAGYAGVAGLTALAVAGTAVATGLLGGGPPKHVPATATTKPSTAAKPRPAYTIPGTPGWHAQPATAPTSCELEELPVPGNVAMALVSGADPTGRYLVGRSYPTSGDSTYQAVLWHDGKGTNVMLPGSLEESLRDVNSGGTAVGWSYDQDGPVPYAYRDGKVSKLPGVRHGSAEAIYDAGAIVGDDNNGTALVWPSTTAHPIRLPVPPGAGDAQARDIDEDGTVVGSLALNKPYVWFADGTHRELPMPKLDGKPAAVAAAFDIRDGWVTGMAGALPIKGSGAKASAKTFAIRWNLRTGEVQNFGRFRYPADAVNAQGWQIGTTPDGYAVMLTDASTVRLPDLAKHRSDGTATIANAVSDDGRTIAGQSDDAGGTINAVVWRCH